MIADLDTRSGEGYAPIDEVLPVPGEPCERHGFARSRERFDVVVGWLSGEEAGALAHAQLEERLEVDARELFCLLLQDHLDLRADREERIEGVVDCEGVRRPSAEAGHERSLQTVSGRFGCGGSPIGSAGTATSIAPTGCSTFPESAIPTACGA